MSSVKSLPGPYKFRRVDSISASLMLARSCSSNTLCFTNESANSRASNLKAAYSLSFWTLSLHSFLAYKIKCSLVIASSHNSYSNCSFVFQSTAALMSISLLVIRGSSPHLLNMLFIAKPGFLVFSPLWSYAKSFSVSSKSFLMPNWCFSKV